MSLKYKTKKDFFINLDVNKDKFNGDEIKIYSFVRSNYKKAAYMNLQEICNVLDVQENTVDEFAQKCGFDDYENFRDELRQIIMVQLKTTDRFKIAMDMDSLKIEKVLTSIVNTEIKNLTELTNTIDEESLSATIEQIAEAEEIIVVGTRASAPLAIYTEYIFNRIGKKTKKIISGGTESFDNLAALDRNSLVLSFGFARYPKETVKILSYFKKKNFKIISITDNYMSPLAHFSDIVLTIPYESVSFTDFYAVLIAVINTIVILLSQVDEKMSLKYLNEFENIAKDMGFYFWWAYIFGGN